MSQPVNTYYFHFTTRKSGKVDTHPVLWLLTHHYSHDIPKHQMIKRQDISVAPSHKYYFLYLILDIFHVLVTIIIANTYQILTT